MNPPVSRHSVDQILSEYIHSLERRSDRYKEVPPAQTALLQFRRQIRIVAVVDPQRAKRRFDSQTDADSMAEIRETDVAQPVKNVSRIEETCKVDEGQNRPAQLQRSNDKRIPAQGLACLLIERAGIVRIETTKA